MSADFAYLDTSAAVKLVVEEPQTGALREELRRLPNRASSGLLRVELVRTARRAGLPRVALEARRLLTTLHLIRLDDTLLDSASDLDPPHVRSLDAIHLASVLSLGADLAVLIAYDSRLINAAMALGIPTMSPA